jgi:hypothetical protein
LQRDVRPQDGAGREWQALSCSLPQRRWLLRLLPAACIVAVRLLLWLQGLWRLLLLPLLETSCRLLRLPPVLLGLRGLLLPLVMSLVAILRLPLLPLATPLAAGGLAPLLGGTTLERFCCTVLRLRQRVLHAQAVSERIVLLLVGAVLQRGIMLQGALRICCILLPVGVLCMVACCMLHIGCILITKGIRLLPMWLLVRRLRRLLVRQLLASLLLLKLLFRLMLPLLLARLFRWRFSGLMRQCRRRVSQVVISLVQLVKCGCCRPGSCSWCIAVNVRSVQCAFMFGGYACGCSLSISMDSRHGGGSRRLCSDICQQIGHDRILSRCSRVGLC